MTEPARVEADSASGLAIGAEPRRVAVAVRQATVYGEGRAFAAATERWLPLLERAARKLSRGDVQLENDMVQEALVELWDQDVSRFGAADQKVLRRMLLERMQFVRLTARMDVGESQWVRGDMDGIAVDEDGEVMTEVWEQRRREQGLRTPVPARARASDRDADDDGDRQ